MQKMLSLMALGFALSFGAAHASEGDSKVHHMDLCNLRADINHKTDKMERNAYIKECMKKEDTTVLERMKACNGQAKEKGLKDAELKAFRRECMKLE